MLLQGVKTMLRLHLVQENGHHEEVKWNTGMLGQRLGGPMSVRSAVYLELVADGAELEYIFMNFSGLRTRDHATQQTWFAEDARFIAANI